jgi:hypothetical protein
MRISCADILGFAVCYRSDEVMLPEPQGKTPITVAVL